MEEILQTYELDHKEFDKKDHWGDYIAYVAWAIQSTIHTTLKVTPAQLVFGRDMIWPITFRANQEELRARQQVQITKDNERENSKRLRYEYKAGDQILLLNPVKKFRKLTILNKGPFVVERPHDNGTVWIRKGPVVKAVNI